MLDHESMARPRQIAQAAAQLARRILGSEIDVIWFGSWPKGTATPHADLDIAVAGAEAIAPARMTELRTALDGISTLHEIDLVDLHTVGATFRQEILRHGLRL